MSEKKVHENIRKSLIYKTAVEYGDYTLNHVTGCSHGCKYPCYAYMMAKRFKKVEDYEEWIQPKLVDNIFPLLSKELPRYKDKIKTLHLCFSTDPYMDIPIFAMRVHKLLRKQTFLEFIVRC